MFERFADNKLVALCSVVPLACLGGVLSALVSELTTLCSARCVLRDAHCRALPVVTE
jgi:hypothetical protein